jgi:hypothetical protein
MTRIPLSRSLEETKGYDSALAGRYDQVSSDYGNTLSHSHSQASEEFSGLRA